MVMLGLEPRRQYLRSERADSEQAGKSKAIYESAARGR